MTIIVESSEFYDEWVKADAVQLEEKWAEKWRVIWNVMKETRHVTLSLGNGEPEQSLLQVVLEYGKEILAKVEDSERVGAIGVEKATLDHRLYWFCLSRGPRFCFCLDITEDHGLLKILG
jgi:Icc-related predicted phosphoesterase